MKYYSMKKTSKEATINIYGDIACCADASAKSLSKQIDGLAEVQKINVYINSYGGEVAEGLAIYNALKRHKAKVITHCEGFAASIASVIFMAGDERIMNESSLLMIHNAWTFTEGNAEQLRKQADDLDKITQASVTAYKAHSKLSEAEIRELMDNETWILPEEALEYGFATKIKASEKANASQNAKMSLIDIIKQHRQELTEEEETEETEEKTTEETTENTDTDEEIEITEETDEKENTEDEEVVEATNDEEIPENEDENTEETDSDNPETPPDENTEKTEDEEEITEAAQKWCGFFNALLKM